MGEIFDNDSLARPKKTQVMGQQLGVGTQTTQPSPAATQTTDAGVDTNTQATDAGVDTETQTTNRPPAATTPTTDANQASGGVGNAGTNLKTVDNNTGLDGTRETAKASTPTYLADWGNADFMDAVRTGRKPIADYMRDYNRWATATGNEPLDVFTMMEAIRGNDINKSYADNEKAKKKLERQQRWEQIGNVLMHLGNFTGALAGAPAATYESAPELSKRQQAVRDAIEKQNGDPQNILAQIWKEREDQRAAQRNAANIALLGAQKANVEGETANEKAVADANVALKGAQKKQAEARERYITDTNKRAADLQPYKIDNLKSATNANNARAAASRASASHSMAETRATNQKTYGDQYKRDRWKIWARNQRRYPNETKEFMKNMNITNSDKNAWPTNVVDEYNAYISDKQQGRKSRGGSRSMLD